MIPVKIGVVGAGGRVGVELLGLIEKEKHLEPYWGIGNKSKGFIHNCRGFEEVSGLRVDVVVDFSSPALFDETLAYCGTNKIPLVSGTTGLTQDQFKKLENLGREVPVLWAPNMSLGIAVFKKALQVFKSTKHFDFQVEEWHHRFKKDSPSGTALLIQAELERVIEKKCPPILPMRAGGIYGVHKVYAVSDEEMIQFEHTAINRTVFARGALFAAEWLLNQKAGTYSIDDVIG